MCFFSRVLLVSVHADVFANALFVTSDIHSTPQHC